jgi:hypothetical protein
MKAYQGVDVYIHIFLTSALAGDEWSASRSSNFIPGEITPRTHSIEDCVDPRAGLDDAEKIFDPNETRNSDPSVVQPVACRYTGSKHNDYA